MYFGAQNISLLRRIVDFLKRPVLQRNNAIRLRFHRMARITFFVRPLWLNLSLSYQPDSIAFFRAHPEFDELFARFVKRNRLNNAGDVPKLLSFILNVKQILAEEVDGEFAELGVWRGNTASILAYFASRNRRHVYLFDTYEGFSVADITGIDAGQSANKFADTSISLVKDVIGEDSACCDFVRGHFPDSVSDLHRIKKYAVVSIDCDLYEPMKAGLSFFYPRMPTGGLFLLHDYSSQFWAGAKLAIDEFCRDTGEHIVLLPDKSGSALLRKTKLEMGSTA